MEFGEDSGVQILENADSGECRFWRMRIVELAGAGNCGFRRLQTLLFGEFRITWNLENADSNDFAAKSRSL